MEKFHDGFYPEVLEGSYQFVKVALEQMDFWKELIGIKCQVIRPKKDSRYSQVYGAVYSNNLPDDQSFIKGNYVVVINLIRMVKKYNETNETVYFYDNKDYLRLGDVLVFSHRGKQFRYKITEIQTLGEMGDTLNYYGILPYIATEFESENYKKFSDNENIEE